MMNVLKKSIGHFRFVDGYFCTMLSTGLALIVIAIIATNFDYVVGLIILVIGLILLCDGYSSIFTGMLGEKNHLNDTCSNVQ